MPRLMSFAKTTQQIRDRTKTVTRRDGWEWLEEGTILWACEKTMGLKQGEKVTKICKIRVVDVRRERVDAILEHIIHELDRRGYAVRETTHDCGNLAGLAQSRERYLLVARHRRSTPDYLYVPPHEPLRGVGEVLGNLPVPTPGSGGGPLHRLPRLSAMNWIRLATIPAGGDWRDLPEEVGLNCSPRATAYGIAGWTEPANTLLAWSCHDNGAFSVADPRITTPGGRREGSLGVTGWNEAATTIISHASIHNGDWSVADPRLSHNPRRGGHGVLDWHSPSRTVIQDSTACKGFNVSDPRLVAPTHKLLRLVDGDDQVLALMGSPLDVESRRSADPVPIIRSLDGTWHRPMTTLELAVLQGFPAKVGEEWLNLDGGSHQSWRQRIGNAVPPPAAEAIARECADVLQAAEDGAYRLRGEPVWVDSPEREVAA